MSKDDFIKQRQRAEPRSCTPQHHPLMGLGGDFDGTPDVTVGLADVSTYPALFAELLARGWTEADCAALAGGNLLRALRAAESAAASGP